MLILAGVTLNSVFSENGIFNRAETAGVKYNEAKAREVLETVLLADGQYEKNINSDYNQDDFLDELIKNEIQGSDIKGDVAIIGEWAFELDRSVPKIGRSLGRADKLVFPTVTATADLATDKKTATINITTKLYAWKRWKKAQTGIHYAIDGYSSTNGATETLSSSFEKTGGKVWIFKKDAKFEFDVDMKGNFIIGSLKNHNGIEMNNPTVGEIRSKINGLNDSLAGVFIGDCPSISNGKPLGSYLDMKRPWKDSSTWGDIHLKWSYTINYGKGPEYVDTVSSTSSSAYTKNGISGNYYYEYIGVI